MVSENAFYYDKEGNINIEAWLSHVALVRPKSRLQLIRNAIALNQLAGKQKTPLGTSCLQQGLVMADLLLDLMIDEDSICAAILYHSVYYMELDLDIIKEKLNSNVIKLLKGALRMDNIGQFLEIKNLKSDQAEKFRKMLFSMADDMRVVLLKLVERVAWMRATKRRNIRTAATRTYAQETLIIYTALANRLGVHVIRYALEDLAMQQLAPRLYNRINTLIKERLADRENYLKELALAIEITLPKVGIKGFRVTHRVKNFYGIYRKMHSKKVALHAVYDLNAIRIVVSTIEECYQVLMVIRTLWEPVAGGLDDYIKSPKANNYRSIHLAVHGVNEKIIEVQIRTFEMDQESEHGLAAHWTYKEGELHKPDYHTKIAWLRQVLTLQKDLIKNGIYLLPGLTATLDDRVYVLAKTGDIIDLPKGATALDFAYHVDPKMGHCCKEVLVDGTAQSLTYVLHTGEQIEVITGDQLGVNWDWLDPDLGYLNTAYARAKVLHWFQRKEHYQHMVTGRLLLEKVCRQLGIQFIEHEKLARDLCFQSKQELLAALGSGELRAVQALRTYSKQGIRYPALESAKVGLQVRELSIKSFGQRRTGVEEAAEIHMVIREGTECLGNVLNILRTQAVSLFSMSAFYQQHEKRTYIRLSICLPTKEDVEELVSCLYSVDNIVRVILLPNLLARKDEHKMNGFVIFHQVLLHLSTVLSCILFL